MKWLSKKGSRGIAYFMIMVLVVTSVITGDVMRVKADDDDSQTTSYTCNLSVSSYDGEHGCIEYLSDEGIWETASSGGVDSVSAKAVRFSAEDGWYVSQVEYNGTTIENPANQYEFDSSGDKSVSGISFSQVDQDDENDSQDNDTDQNQAGDTDQDQDTDQDLEQNPPVYACTLNVSEYDTAYGYIEYKDNSDVWTAVPEDGCSVTATAVRFGAIDGWHVSQIVYNDNTIDDPETDHFDFSEVGDKIITGITFEETVPARRNAPQNLRNTPPAGYCLLMGEYSTDHGKIQYSDDNGSTWEDIPYTGLAEQTPATHVRAVITTEGYGVSYEVEDSIYTDTDSHALTGDRNVQWIQRVTFSNPNKSLTVSEYDATKGTVKISTDGTTWTSVAAAGGNVTARYVKVVPENGYVLNSYSLNSNTVYSENAQELTAQNNTLSNVSFTANAGGGECLLTFAKDDDVPQTCTATVTFLGADNAEKGTATADVTGDIPAGTTKIRISVSEIRYLESVRVIRKAAGAYLGDNNGDEIFRQEIEEALWRTGVAEFAASNAYSYKIALTFSNKKNVMWDYRESARGSDTFVEHCRLYLLDANGNEVAYHDDVADVDTTDYVAYMLTIGEHYKFKLVPDYGYQIAGLTINDYTVAPTDDTGVFEFTMTNNNFHFAGVVTPAVDIVEAPQAYSGATLANGSRAADSGNVKMTIAEKTLDNSAAAVAGEGASAVATLDIDLNKVVSKGDGTYWSDGITEFTNNVTVSVPVPANGLSDGETYTVVRDHNNVKTKLDATYNSTTGMLTFESNKFSDYTVVKTAGTPETTPAQNVSIAVSFSGVDFVDPNDANITESAQEVITNAVPQLYLLTDSATNAYTTINPGGSFTVTPGDPVFIFVKVNSGYEVTMNETGMGLYGFFTGQWNIEEGQSAPGSGSWNRIETDGEWAGAASLSLDIKIQKKDDPGNNTNFDNLQPGLATFSAHYKDDTKSHVDILYFVDGSDDPLSVTAAGKINATNVTGFKIIVEDGYVLTDESAAKIIQTSGTGDHSSENHDYVPLMDYVSEWGFFFEGNEIGETPNTYTCDISNVSVREATPADYVGQYKLIVVTEDGLTLNGNVDTGALDASGHEIDSTYGRVSAGQAGGETGYIPLSDDSTQLFVTLNNDTDRNFFENAVLIGKDANGTQVSSQTFDYATMRDERFVKRAINPAYSYVLTVTLSNKKRIYWTNADVANCTLHLLQAEGNTAPNPNSVRAGTDFRGVIGETYYFLMIPNYGYQVNSLNVNGNDIIPVSGDANMGIFKFVMGNGDFRIQPSLKTSIDKISNTSNQVETVSIANGAAAGVGGNLSMSVSDVATDETAVNAVRVQGDGEVTAVATVNIDLKQVVEQGNGSDWNKELRNLNGAITVGLAVDASGLAPGETYSVVRQHGDDKTELNATYNATTGMLTFPSAAFSAYTIVKKPGTPATDSAPAAKEETKQESSESSSGNDDNDDSNSGSTAKTVASTLGSIVDKTATGGLASKTVIKDWNDLNNVLLKDNANNAAVKNNKKVLADKQKAKGELVQVVLNKKDATIPDSTFDSLYKSDKSGLHVFVANGTALTFINNRQLKNQKALDLTCNVTSANGSKIISFKTYAKLKAKTMLHTTVPAGVKTVTVYKYDAKGNRKYFGKLKPTAEGRVCFGVTELTKYELVYNY